MFDVTYFELDHNHPDVLAGMTIEWNKGLSSARDRHELIQHVANYEGSNYRIFRRSEKNKFFRLFNESKVIVVTILSSSDVEMVVMYGDGRDDHMLPANNPPMSDEAKKLWENFIHE